MFVSVAAHLIVKGSIDIPGYQLQITKPPPRTSMDDCISERDQDIINEAVRLRRSRYVFVIILFSLSLCT